VDAHEREAAGAVAGMVETYGQTLSVGDWVQGTAGGKRFSGEIAEIDGDRVVVEVDGAWLTVSRSDIEQDG
jgi:hypothetical protein